MSTTRGRTQTETQAVDQANLKLEEKRAMGAPEVPSQNKLQVVYQKVIEVKEQIEMKSMKTKIKTPAIILGGLALAAVLISATVVNTGGAAVPSHDQLVELDETWTPQSQVALEAIGEYQLFAHDQLVELDETWTPQSQVAREGIGEYQMFAHDQLVELDETWTSP